MHSGPAPLLLEPRFDLKIWGGRRLATMLGKQLPREQPVGESLESDTTSIVSNGPLPGRSIGELLQQHAPWVLGPRGMAAREPFNDFPLLAKFIDATDVLSVQVHPNDEEALPYDKRGKTEAWHIIHADPGATLITGLKPGISRAEIAEAIQNVELDQFVVHQQVATGDTLLIPAGTIHAIGEGILLYEIQQASDITYRMYDWGRLDDAGFARELHVNQSLEVIRPDLRADRVAPLHIDHGRTMLAACRYFALEQWELSNQPVTVDFDQQCFRLLSVIHGSATARWDDQSVHLPIGQSVLIPAAMSTLELTGSALLLVSYVPDLEVDVIQPLLQAGHQPEDIRRLAGMLGHIQTA
jgi:mannose-6-phosphate isomerase